MPPSRGDPASAPEAPTLPAPRNPLLDNPLIVGFLTVCPELAENVLLMADSELETLRRRLLLAGQSQVNISTRDRDIREAQRPTTKESFAAPAPQEPLDEPLHLEMPEDYDATPEAAAQTGSVRVRVDDVSDIESDKPAPARNSVPRMRMPKDSDVEDDDSSIEDEGLIVRDAAPRVPYPSTPEDDRFGGARAEDVLIDVTFREKPGRPIPKDHAPAGMDATGAFRLPTNPRTRKAQMTQNQTQTPTEPGSGSRKFILIGGLMIIAIIVVATLGFGTTVLGTATLSAWNYFGDDPVVADNSGPATPNPITEATPEPEHEPEPVAPARPVAVPQPVAVQPNQQQPVLALDVSGPMKAHQVHIKGRVRVTTAIALYMRNERGELSTLGKPGDKDTDSMEWMEITGAEARDLCINAETHEVLTDLTWDGQDCVNDQGIAPIITAAQHVAVLTDVSGEIIDMRSLDVLRTSWTEIDGYTDVFAKCQPLGRRKDIKLGKLGACTPKTNAVAQR